MVDEKVLIGVATGGGMPKRPDFYDYLGMLKRPPVSYDLRCHERSPAQARNMIIGAAQDHNCDRVLFIDDDMGFAPDSLMKLLQHDVDIVSGLYLGKAFPHPPMVFDLADPETGACMPMYLFDHITGLQPTVAAGFGFLLVKLSVFDKLEKPYVRLGELDPEQWCDDIGLFNRIRKVGIQSYVDTDVWIDHIGTCMYKPMRHEGKWYTGYDSGGKEIVPVPQIKPIRKVVA